MPLEICVVDPSGRLTAGLGTARYGGNLAVFEVNLDLGGLARSLHVVDVWVLRTASPESVVERCRFVFAGERDTSVDRVPAEKLVRIRTALTKEHLAAEVERRLNPPCDVVVDLGSLAAPQVCAATAYTHSGAGAHKARVRDGPGVRVAEQVTWLLTNLAFFAVCSCLQ